MSCMYAVSSRMSSPQTAGTFVTQCVLHAVYYIGEAATLRRRSEMATRTPTSWVSSTEENIKASRRWIADSVR